MWLPYDRVKVRIIRICLVLAVIVFACAVVSVLQPGDNNGEPGTDSSTDIIPKLSQQPNASPAAAKVESADLGRRISALLATQKATYSVYVQPLPEGEPVLINPQTMCSASMIKVYIMAEAFAEMNQGLLAPNEVVTLTAQQRVGGAGSLQNSPNGTQITINQLIQKMITESDNTATNILISRLSFASINNQIAALGCKNSVLQRKMMDYESSKAGRENFTSAADLGLFFAKIYKGSCISKDLDRQMVEILKLQEDNDKIPQGVPKGTVVAHKTGELEGVIHDGGIIYGPKQDFVLCILTENGEDQAQVTDTIAKIADVAYKFYNIERL